MTTDKKLEKYKQIFSQDSIEYEPSIEDLTNQITETLPTSTVKPYIAQIPDEPDDVVSDAINKLEDKFEIDIDNFSVPEALRHSDRIDTDDPAFNLVSSKLATDVLTRARLKGALAQAVAANRLFDYIIKTYSDKNSEVSAESLLLLDKAAKAYSDLTNMSDQYKKTGLKESLKNIAKARSINNKPQEEKDELSMADIRALIDAVQGKKKE